MKPEEFWDESSIIKDYLFETNKPQAEIAREMGISEKELSQKIKALGLGWVRRHSRKMSRGQEALVKIIKSIIPHEEIVFEYPVGDRLRLDVFIPTYNLGFEYHGRQHFFFSSLFHKTRADFLEGQARDEKKIILCKEQSIALVVFRFCDKLDEQTVFERVLDALNTTPTKKTEKVSKYKGNAYYELSKQRSRERRRAEYRKYKEKRSGNRRDQQDR